MSLNEMKEMLGGLPVGAKYVHKHGYVPDTHGDVAAIRCALYQGFPPSPLSPWLPRGMGHLQPDPPGNRQDNLGLF